VKRVFIILSTNHIGGAEKRFAGLWQFAHQHKENWELHLVLTPTLKKHFENQKAFEWAFRQYNESIHLFEFENGFRGFKKSIRKFLEQHTGEDDVIHFVSDHPLTPSSFRKQVYSITASSLKQYNFKGRLGHFVGVYLSHRIDVLDPKVTKQLQNYFWFKSRQITQTSNSFCETDHYVPEPKKDWLVFLGRFEKMKQFIPFINALPDIHQNIKGLAGPDLHYFILGHGAQEEEAKAFLEQKVFRDIPVSISFLPDPSEILNKSKVFFSLQLYNNYPSKSLLEALSAGNLAVVTDNGNTRDIALPSFSFYVPESFTSEQLATEVASIFRLSLKEMEQKQQAARNFVLENHSLEKMKVYYFDIYNAMVFQN
jgi:glycosyltransferase involved in cell wall biosynthesis